MEVRDWRSRYGNDSLALFFLFFESKTNKETGLQGFFLGTNVKQIRQSTLQRTNNAIKYFDRRLVLGLLAEIFLSILVM